MATMQAMVTSATNPVTATITRGRGPAPVDLVHLARQTFGSAELEREVLRLFVDQGADLVGRIARADRIERAALVHRLKGSARSIGAGRVARLTEALEAPELAEAEARRLIGALEEAVGEVESFVHSIF
ncbi:MAG: Hpt domain-containing protein [Siculibacillus sp.]